MPRTNVLKLGLATGAAIAGAILAITSVAAHSTQATTVHHSSKSVIGSLLEAANSASLPFVAPAPALNGVRDSVETEAEADAAERDRRRGGRARPRPAGWDRPIPGAGPHLPRPAHSW